MGRSTTTWTGRLLRGLDALSIPVRDGVARAGRTACGLACEGLNLGTAAGLVLLTLAQPAFHDTGPGWLKRLDLAVTFLDREGRDIGRRGIRHDDRLGLSEYPDHLIQAVLATEDRRFYQHRGIDPVGLGRALLANAEADGVVQGGSTLTQQLAKNIFLTNERTLERKIREAFLAVWLEARLSKAEILKLYLDRAYMGAGTFGVAAAAEFYFGKSARELSLAEAAMLAGLFKAPSRYAPHLRGPASVARASDVLRMMYADGAISRSERDEALARPATAVERAPEAAAPDYYLDWAFRQVQRLAAEGALGQEAMLTVETPFDRDLQRQAERSVAAALDRDGARLGIGQAALVVMDLDGAVRALVGGRDYGESQFNRATEALRQPGSAFKPFVYAAALAHAGLKPASTVVDQETCISGWCPANYNRGFAGAMPLATALAQSINTVAVRLTVEIGRAAGEWTTSRAARAGRGRVIALAREMGLTTALHDTPSLPLGASEVTVLDMTAAYAGFASGGLKAVPHAALAVRNARGEVVYRHRAPSRRVLGANLAADMNLMLARVVEAGTARRAALPRRPVAGKTGTTSGYRDAWFVGYTGNLVAGVWAGNDDFSPTRKVTGGTLPTAIWQDVMAFAHRDLETLPLPAAVAGEDGGEIAGIAPATGRFAEAPVARREGRGSFDPVERGRQGFREIGPAMASLPGAGAFRPVARVARP